MASTAFTTNPTPTLRPLTETPNSSMLAAAGQPPVLDEMWPDIVRLITSLAHKHCDQSCVSLTLEELQAEGRAKLAHLIHRGELERQPTRLHFFKFLKASINNHFCSLVQRHRFTAKRTGQKPPAQNARPDQIQAHYRKCVDLSLDDENTHVRLSDEQGVEEQSARHLLDDYLTLMNPLEKLVLQDLVQPLDETLLHAYLDCHVGRKLGAFRIRIRPRDHAAGLGLPLDVYRKLVLSIRSKVKNHQAMTQDEDTQEIRYQAAVQQLAQTFGVQVPASTDQTIIRRLFTIAARDQYNKVRLYPQVAPLLEEVGAKVPQASSQGTLACFGVLYKSNDRRCMNCDLNRSCAVEAANSGLGRITLSPRLLGSRGVRYPVIVPSRPEDVKPALLSVDTFDAEVLGFLNETMAPIQRGGTTFYLHVPYGDSGSNNRRLVAAVERMEPLILRFCNPSEVLKKRLVQRNKGWYAPNDATAPEVINLLEQHSNEVFDLEQQDRAGSNSPTLKSSHAS